MRKPRGQYSKAKPTEPVPLRIVAATERSQPDTLYFKFTGHLTRRIDPRPNHHANIQEDDGDRSNKIAKRRVCLHRGPGSFLVRRQRVISTSRNGEL